MREAGRWGELVRTHWPLAVVLLVAAAMRWSNLFPSFFYGDDAEYATVARSLANDPRALAYPDLEGFGAHPFVSQPPLLLYFFAFMSRIVGSVEVGSILVSVLLGTATCGLVYGIGYVIQGRSTGTLAGLVLAVLPPHVDLSRKAFLDAGLTFFMTLAVLSYLLWMRRRTLSWALVTGFAVAGAMLSKLPGVLIAPPLVAAFVYGLWRYGRVPAARGPARLRAHAARRADLRHASWALVPIFGLLFAYLALVWYLRASRNLMEKLGWNVGRVAGTPEAAGSRPDPPWHWYFTDGGMGVFPQFGFAVVVLALVGLTLLLVRAWNVPESRGTATVLALWPLMVIFAFTLSSRKEWFYLLPMAPGTAILAALPLGPPLATRIERVFGALPVGTLRPGTAGSVAIALAVAIAVVPPAVDAAKDVLGTDQGYGYGVKEAALWIQDEDPDAGQIGTLLGRFTLKFYNDQPTYHWFVPHPYVEDEIQQGRIRYVVHDDYLKLDYETTWMQDLVERYNGTVVQQYESAQGNVRVKVYELRPG